MWSGHRSQPEEVGLGLDLRNGPNRNPVHVDDARERQDFGVDAADVVASCMCWSPGVVICRGDEEGELLVWDVEEVEELELDHPKMVLFWSQNGPKTALYTHR